jgi:hypothetical protein
VVDRFVRQVRRCARGSSQVAIVGMKADLASSRAVMASEGEAIAEDLGASVFLEVSAPADSLSNKVEAQSCLDELLLRPLLQHCLEAGTPAPLLQPTIQRPREASAREPNLQSQRSCRSQAGSSPWLRCSQPLLKCFGLVN